LTDAFFMMVHRDLHPGNILVLDEAGLEQQKSYKEEETGLRIVDMGCHKDLWKSFINCGEKRDNHRLFGAISTWSPEFVLSPETVTYSHDVWALGVMFYRFLVGSDNYPVNTENDSRHRK